MHMVLQKCVQFNVSKSVYKFPSTYCKSKFKSKRHGQTDYQPVANILCVRLDGSNTKFAGHPLLLQHFEAFPQQQKRLQKYARLNWLQLLGQCFAGIDDCNMTQTSSPSPSSSAVLEEGWQWAERYTTVQLFHSLINL